MELWAEDTLGDELYGLIMGRVAFNRIKKNSDTELHLIGEKGKQIK